MRQFIGRFVPERFKSPLRDLYYTLEYSVGVRTGRYTEGAPPEYLHDVGPGDYIKIGDEFLRYFIDCGGLRPHERVLDVGSGTGRMARIRPVPAVQLAFDGPHATPGKGYSQEIAQDCTEIKACRREIRPTSQ